MAEWRPNSDRPNDGRQNTTWDFHNRYSSDPEFKRQVDEGRARAKQRASQRALTGALAMTRTRKKLY